MDFIEETNVTDFNALDIKFKHDLSHSSNYLFSIGSIVQVDIDIAGPYPTFVKKVELYLAISNIKREKVYLYNLRLAM